jgi:hypothetical protein
VKLKSKPVTSPAPAPAPVAERVICPSKLTHDQISAEAEAIWRLKGSPIGEDNAIWLQAEHGLLCRRQLERDQREQAALADPRFAFNADQDDLMTELNERFPDRTGKEPTAL